jgi:hypothetical protein
MSDILFPIVQSIVHVKRIQILIDMFVTPTNYGERVRVCQRERGRRREEEEREREREEEERGRD